MAQHLSDEETHTGQLLGPLPHAYLGTKTPIYTEQCERPGQISQPVCLKPMSSLRHPGVIALGSHRALGGVWITPSVIVPLPGALHWHFSSAPRSWGAHPTLHILKTFVLEELGEGRGKARDEVIVVLEDSFICFIKLLQHKNLMRLETK